MRKPARHPFEIGKNPVTPLIMQAIEGGAEEFAVIHGETWRQNLERNLADRP
jgi:hypothetical protein